MEQSKKRDHKIFITEMAISKVAYLDIPEISIDLSKIIQQEHKKILEIAKNENNSNEVLSIISLKTLQKVRINGDEFSVNPSNSIEARTMFLKADRKEIMYLHNHPSTNKFSLPDIMTFILEGKIGLLSVVTNQGEVYILYKSLKYDYNKTKKLFSKVYLNYIDKKLTHNEAVDKFLKECKKGGIFYARSK